MAGGTDRVTDTMLVKWIKEKRASTEKAPKKWVGGGLFLTLTPPPARTPTWRIKYRHVGAERLWTVGKYGKGSKGLAGARKALQTLKDALELGIDPVAQRDARLTAAVISDSYTFKVAASEWLAKRKEGWADSTYTTAERALKNDVYDLIGDKPIRWLYDDPDGEKAARAVIAKIVDRGVHDTANKIWRLCFGICKFGRGKSGATSRENPFGSATEEFVDYEEGHQPALLTFPEVGDVLRRTETARISPAARLCLKLIAHTTSRALPATHARWEHFDLDGAYPTWTVPRPIMKVKKKRPFPWRSFLPPALVVELKAWRRATGGTGWVFRSEAPARKRKGVEPTETELREGRPISHRAIEKVYSRTLGLSGKHVPHGWRSAFSTRAKDNGFPDQLVDLQLDHVHAPDVAIAYDREDRFPARVELVTWWEECLALAVAGKEVKHRTHPEKEPIPS